MNLQQTIIKGIQEQLFTHNYLVLPNFGGFVLKQHPARLSISGGLLSPASKTVSFNIQLKQNDGVLALWLQTKINCSSSEALQHLHEFADYCSGILLTRRRITFDSIGFFYLDFENNICFEPQHDSNFLTASFGLSPISISKLEPEINEPARDSVFVDRVLVSNDNTLNTPPKKRNFKFVSPLLLTLVFMSSLILLVSNTKITGNLKAALFGKEIKSLYNPLNYSNIELKSYTINNKDYVVDANGIATLMLSAGKSVSVKVKVNAKNTPENDMVVSSRSSNFEIVLGCFTVLSNAKRMVAKLSSQNINAQVSDKNEKGMHVVSIGNFESKENAIQKLQQIKESFPKAWIKKP